MADHADAGPLEVLIRDARADDLPAIQRILNREIIEGVAHWDEWPWSDARAAESGSSSTATR